ncbi:DNA-binding domain-containing protein [Amylibacter sp. IMCC11727]|uniref:HvfC/BufC N-terminal domain-containing protein n=1 Tax=Amylibacter sp. IMCC11727 TaxID=3039851 RepID=UPI00244E5ACC|nr:DNA-binding domain-containing protein [Amylibacter sp. IMCC11727]WGI20788.1 DNA-binding domain-containing protein [Amylibacter sp. IMCC11727]
MTVGQSAFTQALLDPDLAIPNGLVDPEGRPAGKRFNVYRNNVIVSLIDAMETAFPVIQMLIGAENFRNLSGLYVRQHPPENPMLMFYGGAFPAFLEAFEPLAHVPYLADVARLELARRAAYHSADATPVAGDALGTIAPDALMNTRMKLAPSLHIIASPYPIASIWHFNMTEGAGKPPAVGETVMITRPALDLDMQVIGVDQAAFLTTLHAGETLGSAFEAATQTDDGFDLSAAIVLMLQSDIITDLKS